MICYLSKNYKGTHSAGNKAKTDIEKIMSDLGYRNVGLPQSTYTNSILSFVVTLVGVLKSFFSLHRGDYLVLQYPLKKYYTLVCCIAHVKGCKVITIIHDLGSFRRQKLTVEQEIKRLNHSDYVIAHNSSMLNWLVEKECKAQMGSLQLFDYLSQTQATWQKRSSGAPYKVLYAGGLASRKNNFLYEVEKYIKSYSFVLYGNGFEADKIRHKAFFEYKGFIPSDSLIASAQGDFGLVWDGDSVDECSGNFGEYLRYNNPHKTSLYIRCGLPVIIWEKAALASFVSQHQIGICVSSLRHLDDILSNISEDEYAQMKEKVRMVNNKLMSGAFLKEALNQAVQLIS